MEVVEASTTSMEIVEASTTSIGAMEASVEVVESHLRFHGNSESFHELPWK